MDEGDSIEHSNYHGKRASTINGDQSVEWCERFG